MKKMNGTTNWILAIIALAVVAYNTISVQAIARTDIKYIKAEIQEIKTLLFRYIIPNRVSLDDISGTDNPG